MATDLRSAQLFTGAAGGRAAAKGPMPPLERAPSTGRTGPLMEWRGFHTELQRAAAAATQTGAPLSLLVLELVSSDRIGESPGSGGAELSDRLTGVVKAAIGARGCLARYAEGRLAVIMIDTDLDEAIGRAEHTVRTLCARRRGATRGASPELSPAIGIAQFRDDESLGHLIQRTAAALGRARSGRGVVADRGTQRPAGPAYGTIARRRCLPLMPSTRDVGGEEPGA